MIKKENRWLEDMSDFARKRIQPINNLGDNETFPFDVWKEMGEKGLLDPQKAVSHVNGLSSRFQILTQAARIMAEKGGCFGLTLSWMMHHLTALCIFDPKNSTAVPEYLKSLIQSIGVGSDTLAFAFSEPGKGGHPKYIATQASKKDDCYFLSGEKSYLTNGPVASAFIVIAVTGQEKEKKSFSAFLVHKDDPGLEIMPPMEIPFFKPAPHGSIKLKQCRILPDALVGEFDRAYQDLVLKFREWEDVLMAGAVSGAMERLLAEAALCASQSRQPDSQVFETLGRLTAAVRAGIALSDQAARALDLKKPGKEGVLLYFKTILARFVVDFKQFINDKKITLLSPSPNLIRDLEAAVSLGKNLTTLRFQKLGRKVVF